MKRHEAGSAQHLLDLYAALSACDAAVIRSRNRSELFNEVCHHIVHRGGVSLAWVGMAEAQGGLIRPEAHCGLNDDYLRWIRYSLDLAHTPSQGMAGAALRNNQACWAAHLQTDPLQSDLHALARAQGWQSAAALPLCQHGVATGVLALHFAVPQAFDERERSLLQQLASNISYALDYLDLDEQRKKAEFALLESEVRYSALFASNCMPMLVIDPRDGRVVDANIRAIAYYGWDHESFTRLHLADFNVLSPEQIAQEMARAASTGKSYFDFRHRVASGEVRDVEVFSSPISLGGQTYLIQAMHDVTERRLLESRVLHANQITQRFIDHLPGTAFVKDSRLRLLMVNEHLARVLGVPAAQLIGKTNREIFPPEFASMAEALDRQMLERGGSHTYAESFGERHVETCLFTIDEPGGERLLAGISLDVTERHNTHERVKALLRINELGGQLPESEFLRAGLDLAAALTGSALAFLHFVQDDQRSLELVLGVCGGTPVDREVPHTGVAVDQLGPWAGCLFTRAPYVCNDASVPIDARGLPFGATALQRLAVVPILEEGQVRALVGVGNRHRDYEAFDVETLMLLGNDLWRIVHRMRVQVALSQRVSELVQVNRKLSEVQLQLLQSEKLASIGQLASGVAHEINNPIGFVKSNLGSLAQYVESLLRIVRAYETVELTLDSAQSAAFAPVRSLKSELDYAFLAEDLEQLIRESREGVQRVSKIVLDLKNFSRSGDGEKEWCDLHAGIESTVNVVWNQLKYKAQVLREFATLPPVFCNASQINQVVMNLLVNAGQAIGGQGHITLRTGVDNAEVWFEVEDDGCGIPTEVVPRLFEPFFTTKPVGQGTGLGLSISMSIVQRHHGRIEVRSEPGRGTCFRVRLPIAPPEVQTASPDVSDDADTPHDAAL